MRVHSPTAAFVLMFTLFAAPVQYSETKAQAPDNAVLIDGVVAVVEDEIILHSEVLMLARDVAMMNKINLQEEPERFNELYYYTLERLIESKVEVVKAKEDTLIEVTNEEVARATNQQIQDLIRQEGSVEALEEHFGGIALKRIREVYSSQMRDRLYIEKLRQIKRQDVGVLRKEIESFYEAYRDSLPMIPETYEISHILMKPKPEQSKLEEKQVLADSIRQLLVQGADFEELAMRFSDDPGSRLNGGLLGWVEVGDFVPEFEAAATALDSGEISQPVLSDYGFHIIQSLGKRGTMYRPRHILLMLRTTRQDEQRLIDTLNVLRERALSGEDFSKLSTEYSDDEGVRKDKGFIGRYRINDIQPQFREAVEGLREGEISEPVKTQFGYHIIRIDGYQEARMPNIQNREDYEAIKNLVLQQKQARLYQEWIEEEKKDIYIDIKENSFIDLKAFNRGPPKGG